MTQKPNSYPESVNVGAAQALVKLGNEYAEEEQWGSALTLYNEAINRYSKLADAYYRRGFVYRMLEKFYEARDDFDKAICLGLQHAEIYFHRGYTLFRIMRGLPGLALNDFNKAIRLKPDYEEAYLERGSLFYAVEDHERAIEDFIKVVQLNPDNDAAYSKRGTSYYEMFKIENAIADFTHVIERNRYERIYAVYYNRAIAYMFDNQHELALQDLAEATRIKPDFLEAISVRHDIYERRGAFRQAIEEATKLISLESDELSNYLRRAQTYDKAGKYQQAIDDLTEAINQAVSFPDVNLQRAEIYIKMGLYDNAIADYEYAISHHPFEWGKQKARDGRDATVRLRNES